MLITQISVDEEVIIPEKNTSHVQSMPIPDVIRGLTKPEPPIKSSDKADRDVIDRP